MAKGRRQHALIGTGLTIVSAHLLAGSAFAGDGAQGGPEDADREAPSVVIVTGTRTEGYKVDSSSTGTRTNTPLRDVPQSITVIPSDLIRDQSMQSITDVIRPRAGCGDESRREQPGHRSLAGNHVDVGLLRQWRARRRSVLPRSLQHRRGGGLERSQCDDLRSRGRRRGHQSRHENRRLGSAGEIDVQTGSYDDARITADISEAFSDAFAGRVTAMLREHGGIPLWL